MKEFIRDNVVFIGQYNKFTPDANGVALVEFKPGAGDNGECTRIMFTEMEEIEALHSFLGVYLQESDDVSTDE